MLLLVIAVGFVLARFRVLPAATEQVLSRLVFFVATPALLLHTLETAPVGTVLSSSLAITAIVTTVGIGGYLVLDRLFWRRPLGERVIGALSASYVNAGNLGLAVTSYLFGSAAYVAPVMMYQLVVLAPVAFVVLDLAGTGVRPSPRRVLLQPVRNPLVLASALGVLLALTGRRLPMVLEQPVELIGAMAVPGALIAFGMSLYGAPLPGRGGGAGRLLAICGIKLLMLPAVAYALGRWMFGLDPTPLLAVTLCAALPTAQNIFVYASRYRTGVGLARDAVASTTVLCVPVLISIVALVHR